MQQLRVGDSTLTSPLPLAKPALAVLARSLLFTLSPEGLARLAPIFEGSYEGTLLLGLHFGLLLFV